MFRLLLLIFLPLTASVEVGLERLFTPTYSHILKGRNVALVTNQTAITSKYEHAIDLFKENEGRFGYRLRALFGPEHGIDGAIHAEKLVLDGKDGQIPIYSLYGNTRRPTDEMLNGIDLVVYDIQDIGSRSYTYISTLFYVMEEAAKRNIDVLVLDRPNPINGVVVDGPMLQEAYRSIVGYINVPYCHGMTVAELAMFFNREYQIRASLQIVPMKGWNRQMSFHETKLPWIPTSPNVPKAETALYYPITGILGEIPFVQIGVGYTLPFQLAGAPFVDKKKLAMTLNQQVNPGVHFHPFSWTPYSGKYKDKLCHGVMIHVHNPLIFQPVTAGFTLMGALKALYPKEFDQAIQTKPDRKEMLCKVCGSAEAVEIMNNERYITWKLKNLDLEKRNKFLVLRKKYLLRDYPML